MLRFVLGPGGRVYFDLKQNLPGESVAVKNSKALLTKMIAEFAFRDMFAKKLNPEEYESVICLPEEVTKQYLEYILQIISLANKAGALIIGKRRVEDCISSSKNTHHVLIVQAIDASASEKFRCDGKIPVVEIFSKEQLSKACGKENLLYTAVLGDFAKKVTHFAAKYQEYICN
ncbi:MAG: DUF448 domain-containing protein [Rickettsiaceae bacterium]|nr:DUF448 domain-containing protein [Rickettsiaceae bacterium]